MGPKGLGIFAARAIARGEVVAEVPVFLQKKRGLFLTNFLGYPSRITRLWFHIFFIFTPTWGRFPI